MYCIENDALYVEFVNLGAEMTRLYDKKNKEERLWDGNPKFWAKRSPVLFPFVGASKEGRYSHEGETYSMGRHGFAREMNFSCIHVSHDRVSFEIVSTPETRKVYPYDFAFRIHYQLLEDSLKVTYDVLNANVEDMIFSVGGHPAFFTDYGQRACFLEFEAEEEDLKTTLIDLDTGLLKRKSAPISLEGRRLELTSALFENDALIFHGLKSKWIKLIDPGFKMDLKVDIQIFPALGIWSPLAPFVCIEPWQGTADYEDATGNLSEKEGTMVLKGFETYEASYTITLSK